MKTKIVTSDIYLVASLLALGNKIESVDKSDSRHMKFTIVQDGQKGAYTFTSTSLPDAGSVTVHSVDLDYYENLWNAGQLMINALAFKHSFQHVQSVIHST